jgi:hypothetical protein
MTDLKTANKQLAEAIEELESIAHADDVREAEAIRLRLLELDERIGGRIKAKLEAHKLIALSWQSELLAPGQINAKPAREWRETTMDAALNSHMAGTLTTGLCQTPEVEPQPIEKLADAWQAHHEQTWDAKNTNTGDYHTRYGLTKGQIVEPVLANGVAEMQQAVLADEQ